MNTLVKDIKSTEQLQRIVLMRLANLFPDSGFSRGEISQAYRFVPELSEEIKASVMATEQEVIVRIDTASTANIGKSLVTITFEAFDYDSELANRSELCDEEVYVMNLFDKELSYYDIVRERNTRGEEKELYRQASQELRDFITGRLHLVETLDVLGVTCDMREGSFSVTLGYKETYLEQNPGVTTKILGPDKLLRTTTKLYYPRNNVPTAE